MKQKDHCYVLFFCLPLSAIDQIAGYSIAEMIRRRFQGGIRLTTPEPLRSALDTLKSCDGGLLAAAAFLQVLDALLGTPTVIPLAQKSLDDGQTHQTSEAVTRIGDFLARHYRERLTLEAIAEATCISVPTMCRLFRRRTGHSVFEYLREIRISRVKWQLAWTDRSITDIAGDCGFETLGHFYRTFHATTHLSPSAYRRSIQKRMHFPLRSP